jgi:hypothetical protein
MSVPYCEATSELVSRQEYECSNEAVEHLRHGPYAMGHNIEVREELAGWQP